MLIVPVLLKRENITFSVKYIVYLRNIASKIKINNKMKEKYQSIIKMSMKKLIFKLLCLF